MISSKKDMAFYIEKDKLRNVGNISRFNLLLNALYRTDGYKSFRYLRTLRHYEYSINVLKHKNIIGLLSYWFWKLRWHRLSEKYDIVIPPNVIGYGFKMAHIVGGGIIINCKHIGNYCSANAGVVVGNNGGQNRIAIIGNHVSLTVGCKVIGDVVIGDNVTVAPNSVVIKNVPPNAVVSGVPAKIILLNGKKVMD